VRLPGRDPASLWGDELGVRYQPGFSLAMEREAYAAQNTILFELAEAAGDKNAMKDRSEDVHELTMRGPMVALRWVLDRGYGSFPEGNSPPRNWSQDLARMGLAGIIPRVERAAQYAPPPVARGRPATANRAGRPNTPAPPAPARRGPPRQRAR